MGKNKIIIIVTALIVIIILLAILSINYYPMRGFYINLKCIGQPSWCEQNSSDECVKNHNCIF